MQNISSGGVGMRTQIKKIYNRIKQKTKNFLKWIWQECKDGRTLALLLVVITIVYSPVWLGYIMHWVFGWNWAGIVATAMLAFWAGPFSPFFVLCISITLGIKRLFEKKGKFCRARPEKCESEIAEGENIEKKLDISK